MEGDEYVVKDTYCNVPVTLTRADYLYTHTSEPNLPRQPHERIRTLDTKQHISCTILLQIDRLLISLLKQHPCTHAIANTHANTHTHTSTATNTEANTNTNAKTKITLSLTLTIKSMLTITLSPKLSHQPYHQHNQLFNTALILKNSANHRQCGHEPATANPPLTAPIGRCEGTE